jgi:subtilisin family serine protease
MAAPFVAGLAALVQSFDAQLTPDEVARRITDTAHEVGGDVRWRIDAAAALGAGPDAGTNPVLFLPMLSAGGE